MSLLYNLPAMPGQANSDRYAKAATFLAANAIEPRNFLLRSTSNHSRKPPARRTMHPRTILPFVIFFAVTTPVRAADSAPIERPITDADAILTVYTHGFGLATN